MQQFWTCLHAWQEIPRNCAWVAMVECWCGRNVSWRLFTRLESKCTIRNYPLSTCRRGMATVALRVSVTSMTYAVWVKPYVSKSKYFCTELMWGAQLGVLELCRR